MSEQRQDLYYEDVVIGAELRSASHAVSAVDIGRFCDLTRDHHPLHTEVKYAKSRGFPDVIAHGLFGLSLMEGLKTELKIYENSSIASLGWDQVRFLRPVVAGDVVHVVFRFTGKRPSARSDRGVVTESLQLINQRAEPVIEALHITLIACREASATA